jgi:hypothetical protein
MVLKYHQLNLRIDVTINAMRALASIIICVFFVLIVTKLIEFYALHGGLIRPFQIYGVLICAALGVVALHVRLNGFPDLPRDELVFFVFSAALVLWIVARTGHQEGSWRVGLWPLANLVMGACLFCFARFMGFGSIIRAALISSLVVQLASICIDLWIPGTFAEWAPRPAGLPQNSNNGALLICLLLAALLPNKAERAPSVKILIWLAISLPLIFVTLSRSGLFMFAAVAAIALANSWRARGFGRRFFLAGSLMVITIGATLPAPALRQPDTIAIWRDRVGMAAVDLLAYLPALPAPTAGQGPVEHTVFDLIHLPRQSAPSAPMAVQSPMDQAKWDEAIRISDDTINQRKNALRVFWRESWRRPVLGLGTGYTFRDQVGPHNMLIGLFVDQGAPAVLIFVSILCALSSISLRRQSPALLAFTCIGWMNSMFSHTVLYEPWFLAVAGAVLGGCGTYKLGPVVTPRAHTVNGAAAATITSSS